MGYFLIALLFIFFYQGLIKAFGAKEKLFIKLLITTLFALLLSTAMYNANVLDNNLKQLLILWASFSVLGAAYVLLESKLTIMKL